VLSLPHPLRFLLVAFAEWINQQKRELIDHLQEENRVLRGRSSGRDRDSPTISASAWPPRPGSRAVGAQGNCVVPAKKAVLVAAVDLAVGDGYASGQRCQYFYLSF
jgi:hypothetical protein